MPPPELPAPRLPAPEPDVPRLPAPPPSPTPLIVPPLAGAPGPVAVAAGPRCTICGQTPAAAAAFNAHTGMVVAWRRSVISGLFCRSCGIGVFRKQMNHTLAFGWFGLIAFFANFYAILKNLGGRATIRRLAPPPEPQPRVEGRPLFARYGLYVGVGVLAALGTISAIAITTSEAEELSGECFALDGDELLEVPCSQDHDGKVVAVLETDSTERCPSEADDVLMLEADEGHVMCVDYGG